MGVCVCVRPPSRGRVCRTWVSLLVCLRRSALLIHINSLPPRTKPWCKRVSHRVSDIVSHRVSDRVSDSQGGYLCAFGMCCMICIVLCCIGCYQRGRFNKSQGGLSTAILLRTANGTAAVCHCSSTGLQTAVLGNPWGSSQGPPREYIQQHAPVLRNTK